ncbi:MAG: hypothetical protein U0359_27460 [Byssovorax sp.]
MLAACGGNGSTTGSGGGTTGTTTSTTTSGTAGGGTGGTGGGGGDWSCLGDIVYPDPSAPMVKVSFVFLDHLSHMPITDMSVKACPKNDPPCAGVIDQGNTDADGAIALTVPSGPAGFDGSFNLDKMGYPTSRVLVYPMPSADSPVIHMTIVSVQALQLGLADVGTKADPTRGHVAIAGLDCGLLPAPGVSFQVLAADGKSTTAYVAGMGLDEKATATGPDGVGIVFNVPIGPTKVSATREATKMPIGVVDAPVEVGGVTYVSVPPTPPP